MHRVLLSLRRMGAATLLVLALFAIAVPMASASGDAWSELLTGKAATKTAPAESTVPRTAELRCDVRHLGDCVETLVDTANLALARLFQKLPLLVLGALVILLTHWLSRFVGNRLHLLRIRSQNPYMSSLVRMIVRTAIMLIGILIALDVVGLTSVVGAVLGSAGVVGLVLGFAFRDIAENYIAGILLSVRRPFEPGEHVMIDTREGKVIAVNSRATVLMTMDGNHLQLPNSLVFKSVVLNYSKNPKRRFDFTMLIDGSQSIRESQTLAIEAISKIDGVLDTPAPAWTVVEYGANGILLKFFGWVDQRSADLGKARSEAIRQVKAAFQRAGIEGPRTTYHVVTTRSQNGDEIEDAHEPVQNGVDTSVNHEIDVQVQKAIRDDDTTNLLDPDTSRT
ncbi:MAG: mechanosensitive ion channel [Xanthomonadaceae bacterium]|nr:mechanosensitive ion channel [Xanthomonadaceae bacterium]